VFASREERATVCANSPKPNQIAHIFARKVEKWCGCGFL